MKYVEVEADREKDRKTERKKDRQTESNNNERMSKLKERKYRLVSNISGKPRT